MRLHIVWPGQDLNVYILHRSRFCPRFCYISAAYGKLDRNKFCVLRTDVDLRIFFSGFLQNRIKKKRNTPWIFDVRWIFKNAWIAQSNHDTSGTFKVLFTLYLLHEKQQSFKLAGCVECLLIHINPVPRVIPKANSWFCSCLTLSEFSGVFACPCVYIFIYAVDYTVGWRQGIWRPAAGLLIAQKHVDTVKWAECRPQHEDQFFWFSSDSVLTVVLSRYMKNSLTHQVVVFCMFSFFTTLRTWTQTWNIIF